MQPSSRVIFLYSLPKSVVEPMQFKGVDYNSVIKEIGDYDGVEVYDLNRDFFSKPHKCNLLIILGEFLEDKNALLLQDDTIFPLADLVNLIGSSFREVNVIDCAWCYSGKGKTHDELKRLTNALVNTINGYTGAETRLALYWLLLKDNKLLGRENYKGCYDKKLSDLGVYQDSMNPKQLASLSEGTNLGTMSTSAAPKTVYRNSPFQVKVYIHKDGNEADLNAEIDGYGFIPRRIRGLKLNNGDQILWELSFNTNPKPEYAKHILGADRKNIIWDSEKTKADYTFECFVEQEFEVNGFNGVLKTTVGKNEIDKWIFPVTVLPYKDLLGGNTSIAVKSDENSISELNSTNIKNVEVDDKILEAFQNDSKEERKRPVAIGVKSGFSDVPNAKEQMEKMKQKEELKVLRREKILNQLLEWVDSGDWINDEVANEVKQMLLTVLGRGEIQLEDKEKDMSETLWNLLEVGRVKNNEYNKNRNTEKYGCLATAWQNLVGYFDDKKLFKRKGSPALNKDFFGNTDGYTNIDKGRPSKDTGKGTGTMSSRFRDVLDLLDAYCPSK